ncbi:MAG: Cro/C1-type helix-turn-helix domain protein [Bacteriophage sp.]|nr:MAG: Cro/C1-type helix-turn-helix domain protein [Bacteriophage sp.]
MTIKYSVGDRIQSELVRQKISQRELARRSGIKAPTISYLVTGATTNPTMSILVSVAAGLGVSLDWLCTGKEFER